MKYHFFIKKYETVCHTHNCWACLQKSLCYRRWQVTPTTQCPVAWMLNWAPPHGRWAREGFCPQDAKLWPVDIFFLTAAHRWTTGLGLPDAQVVNKTAHFIPCTAAHTKKNKGGFLSLLLALSCGKQRASHGSTKSRPHLLCCGALLLSSLIRSCPERTNNSVSLSRFPLT